MLVLPFRRSKGVVIHTPQGDILIHKGTTATVLIEAPSEFGIERMHFADLYTPCAKDGHPFASAEAKRCKCGARARKAVPS